MAMPRADSHPRTLCISSVVSTQITHGLAWSLGSPFWPPISGAQTRYVLILFLNYMNYYRLYSTIVLVAGVVTSLYV